MEKGSDVSGAPALVAEAHCCFDQWTICKGAQQHYRVKKIGLPDGIPARYTCEGTE